MTAHGTHTSHNQCPHAPVAFLPRRGLMAASWATRSLRACMTQSNSSSVPSPSPRLIAHSIHRRCRQLDHQNDRPATSDPHPSAAASIALPVTRNHDSATAAIQGCWLRHCIHSRDDGCSFVLHASMSKYFAKTSSCHNGGISMAGLGSDIACPPTAVPASKQSRICSTIRRAASNLADKLQDRSHLVSHLRARRPKIMPASGPRLMVVRASRRAGDSSVRGSSRRAGARLLRAKYTAACGCAHADVSDGTSTSRHITALDWTRSDAHVGRS